MRVNRFKWSPRGMLYDDKTGEYITFAAHAAIVTFYEAQIEQLASNKDTQIVSLGDAVLAKEALVAEKVDLLDAKEQELFDALVRIEELERALPALPLDEEEIKP